MIWMEMCIKINNFIKFPYLLRASKWFGDNFNHQFELKSVVEHLGGANSGHFLTMRKLNWSNDAKYNVDALEESHKVEELNHKSAFIRSLTDLNEGSDYPSEDWNPGAWIIANDSSVSFISLSEVLKSTAYMLFYERIN